MQLHYISYTARGLVSSSLLRSTIDSSKRGLFWQVIHWAIVLNVIIIAMADEADRGALADLGQFLTILFAAEASFKIYVLGATQYFKSR